MSFKCSYSGAAAKSLQSCPTLCDPIDGSPLGILLARTLEWLAISFSSAWKWKGIVQLLSRVRLLATPWTAAYQAPPSMGFSRQEYWSGLSLPSPHSSYSRHSQLTILHLYDWVCNSYLPLFPNKQFKKWNSTKSYEMRPCAAGLDWRKHWSLLKKKETGGSSKVFSRKEANDLGKVDGLSNKKPEEMVGWVRKKANWKGLQSDINNP